LHSDQDATAMAALMSGADLAIGAGGSMAWERCVLGLPTIMLTIADNQRDIVRELVGRGAAVLAGPGDEVSAPTIGAMVEELTGDPGRRAAMARTAARICDGRGAKRVATLLTGGQSRGGAGVKLRPSALTDRDTLFAWQQISGMRRYFKNPTPPTAAEHASWFAAVRADPRVRLFMITVGDVPAGTLRLEETEDGAQMVSILVAPDRLRRGLAGIALGLVHAMWPQSRFLAEIHAENSPSLALFSAAGYGMSRPGLHIREPSAGAP
jgi:UDP-2,4-diacetamido-2,4,6-trideoxy-beta-L-altropyranose hydrolase